MAQEDFLAACCNIQKLGILYCNTVAKHTQDFYFSKHGLPFLFIASPYAPFLPRSAFLRNFYLRMDLSTLFYAYLCSQSAFYPCFLIYLLIKPSQAVVSVGRTPEI